MDTEIIMLRGALHDKEQELADQKELYAELQKQYDHHFARANNLEDRLEELLRLVREIDELWEQKEYYSRIYNQGEIQMTYFGKIGAIDLEIRNKLKQAVGLATDNSKEEKGWITKES